MHSNEHSWNMTGGIDKGLLELIWSGGVWQEKIGWEPLQGTMSQKVVFLFLQTAPNPTIFNPQQ